MECVYFPIAFLRICMPHPSWCPFIAGTYSPYTL